MSNQFCEKKKMLDIKRLPQFLHYIRLVLPPLLYKDSAVWLQLFSAESYIQVLLYFIPVLFNWNANFSTIFAALRFQYQNRLQGTMLSQKSRQGTFEIIRILATLKYFDIFDHEKKKLADPNPRMFTWSVCVLYM
jgi:hypothetical protein